MVSSKQVAVAVMIGLMFRGKVPPLIWDEPRMSNIQEGTWGGWQSEGVFREGSFRRRILERTAEFRIPHGKVQMQLQAIQHESSSRISTPLWEVRRVEVSHRSGKVTALTSADIGRQCWLNGRASIAPLVEAAKPIFQPEDSPVV